MCMYITILLGATRRLLRKLQQYIHQGQFVHAHAILCFFWMGVGPWAECVLL